MYITGLSPSAYNVVDDCEMKYFIGNVLRIREPSNLAAEKGTFVHEVLEILANYKKANQDNILIVDTGYEKRAAVPVDTVDIDELFNHVKQNFKFQNKVTDKDYKECRTWVDIVLSSSDDPRKLNIVQSEHKFSLKIDEPWANYYYETDKGIEKGQYSINGIIDLVTKVNEDTYKFTDYKHLLDSTPIPTLKGWSTIKELKVGDIIFDKDGAQTKVIGKSKPKIKECLKIIFDDKSEAVCSKEHLWTLFDGVVETAENLKIGDKIATAKPLKIKPVDLPIDPYVLGVWLGDGCKYDTTITGNDNAIFNNIQNRGYKVGPPIKPINTKHKRRSIYGIRPLLKQLGLVKNKHIPDIYLRASFEQRLDLLRGLMDTDGNANPYRKQAVFTSCNKRLSNQVKELLLSLGQRVNQAHVIRDTTFKKNVHIYPLHFRPIKINPFLLSRKVKKIKAEWGCGNSSVRTIIKIKKISKPQNVQCIKVDSPTSTFLCTKNMIPTHNTGQRKDWVTGTVKEYDDLFKDIQLNIYHYCLRQLYPDINNFIVNIFYIKDGGPFDLIFDKKQADETLSKLKKQFMKIREITIPKLSRTWKCKKFCHYSKLILPDAPPEFRKNQLDEIGVPMCACAHLHELIKLNGINKVTQDYKGKKTNG